jgi:hypothetical protein
LPHVCRLCSFSAARVGVVRVDERSSPTQLSTIFIRDWSKTSSIQFIFPGRSARRLNLWAEANSNSPQFLFYVLFWLDPKKKRTKKNQGRRMLLRTCRRTTSPFGLASALPTLLAEST